MTAVEALGRTRDRSHVAELEQLYGAGPLSIRAAAVRATGEIGPPGFDARCKQLILSQEPNEVRSAAVRVLARFKPGLNVLLDLQQKQQLPAELKNLATTLVNASRDPEIHKRAETLLPPLVSSSKKRIPPIQELMWRAGDAERGRKVFNAETGPKCGGCHSVGGKKKVGPDLASIGAKLGKDGLYDSILNPSAGIAPDFYLWVLETKTQGDVIGIITRRHATARGGEDRCDSRSALEAHRDQITSPQPSFAHARRPHELHDRAAACGRGRISDHTACRP